LTGVEEYEPSCDWEKGQEKLPCDRYHQARHERSRHRRLEQRALAIYHAQAEYADHSQEEILRVIVAPLMRPKGSKGVCGVERGFDGGY
ncbi:UNVERIFIED_CONTAM: hypothetical protein NY603_23030, partial [Bacteroidetes bacterium 56_B9]